MAEFDWGLWALLPLVATLVIALVSRSALIAVIAGTFVGTVMPGRRFQSLRKALG
jgi:hypothetical protein